MVSLSCIRPFCLFLCIYCAQVVLYSGSQDERKAAKKALPSANVVITSYSLMERPDTKKYLEVSQCQ